MMRTDNPVLDAERYAAQQEERDSISCDLCGGEIFCGDDVYYGDEYYRIEGQNICQDCIRRFLRKRRVTA